MAAPTVRGMITNVNTSTESTSFLDAFGQTLLSWMGVSPSQRTVDVVTTSSGSAVPRHLKNVPWNLVNAVGTQYQPKQGDQVMLGFSGGNSEFPHVLSYLPGDNTIAAQTNAETPLSAISAGIQALAFSLLSPIPSTIALFTPPFESN